MRRSPVIAALALTPLFALSACSDDKADKTSTVTSGSSSSSSSTTTAGGSGKKHTEMSPAELEVWQADLNTVGCWAGPVDGKLGGQTEAAIKEFQAAQGLTVDGLLGPATESALQKAAAAGKTVCTTTGTTTTRAGAGGASSSTTAAKRSATVSVQSPSYSKSFSVTSCTPTQGGTRGVVLAGRGEGNISLSINAPTGSGTITISGGTEQDGVSLSGSVSSATVSDAAVSASGTFSDGSAFTVSGYCA